MVWRTAKWIGAATWHANHSRGKPGRDTGASRRLAVEATKAARARHGQRQRDLSSDVATTADKGGHTIVQSGAFWQCSVCMKRSRFKAKLQGRKCEGSARRRWWCKSAKAILEHSSEPASQPRFQHIRMVSGDITWCTICGAYGEHHARGLAQFCQGKFEGTWKGGGRVAQLKALKSNRHPKTGKPIPQAVPENEWLAGKRTYIGTSSAPLSQSVPEPSRPMRLCQASVAILDRLQQRRRVGQEAIEPTAKRRRVTGKSTPSVVDGTEVEARAGNIDGRSRVESS